LSAPTLVLEQVSHAFGDRTVLDRIDLTVQEGETLAITGPSGSGKSTLLHIAAGLMRPDSGGVHAGAIDVGRLNPAGLAAYRASQIGLVFQDHHLLAVLTALENVLLPTLAAVPRPAPAQAAEQATALMGRLGIAHRLHAYPAEMSGGERQRVAIARAMVNGPGLLLCDEPTGNLDSRIGSEVVGLLNEIAHTERTSVVMVTHNAEHASRFHRAMRLEDGRLIAGAR